MPIYRHRITGPGPAGDIWSTGLFTSGTADLATTHAAWKTFTDAFFGSDMAGLWATETQANEIITDQLDAMGWHNVAQARTTVNYKGTGSGGQMSQRTSVVVGLRTALPTRSGRGRMYVPAPGDDQLTTEGLLLSTTADNISGYAATALETLTGVSTVVIAHRNTEPGGHGISGTTPVTYVTVGQVLGTQIRRTNKVPPNYQSTDLA